MRYLSKLKEAVEEQAEDIEADAEEEQVLQILAADEVQEQGADEDEK